MECQRALELQYHHQQHQTHAVGCLHQHHHQQQAEQGAGAVTAGHEGCTVLDVEMEVQEGSRAADTGKELGRGQGEQGGGQGEQGGGERLASEAAESGGDTAQLPFSRELITLSLFGKMPPKYSEFTTK